MKIKNICKSYNDKIILNNINLEFNQGLNLLIGPNGSGKTTLLEIISGYRKESSGEIVGNENIAVLFQENSLRKNISLQEEINLYQAIFNTNNEYVQYLIKKLNLVEYLNELNQKLSIGTQRRALFLLTLLNENANILILDEPTSGLDINSRSLIWNLIYEISKKKAIIISDHYLSEAKKYIDTITIINKGKIILSKNINDFLNDFEYKYIKNNQYLKNYQEGALEINVEDIYAFYLKGELNV